MNISPYDYQKDYGWRRITPTERAEMLIWLDAFTPTTRKEERAKAILEYFVRDNISAQAIVRKHDPRIVGYGNRNKGKPLTTMSVLRIIYEYFPNLKSRTTSTKGNKRVELIRKRETTESPHIRQCAFCGATDNLEEHHMIPLFMGGTNDDNNLVFLCHTCHKRVNKYQRQIKNGSTQCSCFRL